MPMEIKRNARKTTLYVQLMGYKCCNPDCSFGLEIQGHHIRPVAKGGENEYQNIISLCRKCHKIKGLHSKWWDFETILLTWKFYKELEILGTTSDCNDKEFLHNVSKMKAECRKEVSSAEEEG